MSKDNPELEPELKQKQNKLTCCQGSYADDLYGSAFMINSVTKVRIDSSLEILHKLSHAGSNSPSSVV